MNRKGRFLKIYDDDIKGLDDPDLTEKDKKIIEINKSGAFFIYTLMYRRIIRRYWNDHLGFPLKKEFYNKNFLVCSISIRKLVEESGFKDQKIQKLIKQLEEVGWIVKDNEFTKRAQNVYILGTWGTKKTFKAGKYVNEYYEELYSNSKNNKMINKDFSLDDIYGDNFELEFRL